MYEVVYIFKTEIAEEQIAARLQLVCDVDLVLLPGGAGLDELGLLGGGNGRERERQQNRGAEQRRSAQKPVPATSREGGRRRHR